MRKVRDFCSRGGVEHIGQLLPACEALKIKPPHSCYVEFGGVAVDVDLCLVLTVLRRSGGLEQVLVIGKQNELWAGLSVPKKCDQGDLGVAGGRLS